jgi:glycosyltransferase involved in cell wall biosynthesis
VIPVWDEYVALRFEEALASVVAQDVPLDIIVVDNASRVPLPDMPDVVVIRIPQRVSLGAARNAGLERVRTENVMFTDADDLIEPWVVRRLESGLDSDPRLVAYAMAFVDADTGQRHRWPWPLIGRLVRFPRLCALLNAVWAIYPITGAVLIRTSQARAVGGHSDVDNGDARCLGAALLFRGRVGWSEELGYLYHQHPGSNLDRFSGVGAILDSHAAVRRRLRSGLGGPSWLRPLIPLIAVAQWTAVAAHLMLTGLRQAAAARAARAER